MYVHVQKYFNIKNANKTFYFILKHNNFTKDIRVENNLGL